MSIDRRIATVAERPPAEADAPAGTMQRRIYDRLRWALMSGRFAPGEGISLRKLAAAFDTSTTPVREALRRLESEGGLVAGANRVLSVPQADLAALHQLYDVRLALEGMAAARAAERIGPGELEIVEAACAAMAEATAVPDVERYLEQNWRFHAAIYRAARSPLLLGQIEGLWLRAGPMIRLAPGPAHFEQSMRSHRAAVVALRCGDPKGARDAIERDLSDAAADLTRLLREREGEA
jgi:DNA-binding GntR family transcriptional regulator